MSHSRSDTFTLARGPTADGTNQEFVLRRIEQNNPLKDVMTFPIADHEIIDTFIPFLVGLEDPKFRAAMIHELGGGNWLNVNDNGLIS